ncbi:MAG: hypothetical protein OEW12_07745 [Deltaproteobacteria bacterium]|nr:hypothetical protein [Deltaproteobacteria bacterium]
MIPGQSKEVKKLIKSLESLKKVVEANPSQPHMQAAETAVSHWQRVAEGRGIIPYRLNDSGVLSQAFHMGMEQDPALRIDKGANGGDLRRFPQMFQGRREGFHRLLKDYFERPGYRSSGDQCDLVVLETARLSRFLGMWCLEAELAAPGQEGATPDLPEVEDDSPTMLAKTYLPYIRWHMLLWEPYLNEAIVSWEENQLPGFEKALEVLLALLEVSAEDRKSFFPPEGYPIREIGRERIKIWDSSPEQRPMRGHSVFNIRYVQLIRLLQETKEAIPHLHLIQEDVITYIAMFKANRFLTVGSPGFSKGGGGVQVVRANTETHPFLLAPVDFYKKAMLFHNETYSVDGGGVGDMYLMLRQLERHFKFQLTNASRLTQGMIMACLVAWDENRAREFTRGMLRLAEHLREGDHAA